MHDYNIIEDKDKHFASDKNDRKSIELSKKESEYKYLDKEDTPLGRIRENRTFEWCNKEIETQSIAEDDLYYSLGSE